MTSRETISEHGLTVRVQHRRNPYDYMLDDEQLAELLLDAGFRRAGSIWHNHVAVSAPREKYRQASMGFVLMDPTAPSWEPHEHAVLGVVTVGADGHRFLPNAAAKAAGHRRTGRNHGEAVLVDPHLCGSGSFRYGHSAEVRGQIVGASSQSTDQDLFEAGQLANDFVQAVTERHRAWEDRRGPADWLTAGNEPPPEYQAMVSFFAPTAIT